MTARAPTPTEQMRLRHFLAEPSRFHLTDVEICACSLAIKGPPYPTDCLDIIRLLLDRIEDDDY